MTEGGVGGGVGVEKVGEVGDREPGFLCLNPTIKVPFSCDDQGFSALLAKEVQWVQLRVAYVFSDGSCKSVKFEEVKGVECGGDDKHSFFYLEENANIHGIVAAVRGDMEFDGQKPIDAVFVRGTVGFELYVAVGFLPIKSNEEKKSKD